MTRIAAADQKAMNALYATAVTAGLKTAGVVDKSPENTETVFKDHEQYISTLEEILDEDKKTTFEPNDPIMD